MPTVPEQLYGVWCTLGLRGWQESGIPQARAEQLVVRWNADARGTATYEARPWPAKAAGLGPERAAP